MGREEVPVLVAGGSLVGMTTAMLLAGHGTRPLVVERHPGAAIHPRAAFILLRSMEILRNAGIERPVVEKSMEQFEPDGAIMSAETFAGRELAWHLRNVNEGVEDLSPSRRTFVTQIALEPELCRRARELGADVRFSTEVVEVAPDDEGVTATLRDRASGETTTVRAQYLIAADGPRSPIRERLGIEMRGRGIFSHAITIYFRADVEPLLRGRNLSVVMVNNPVFRGFFRIEKPYRSGFLVIHTLGDPEKPVTDAWNLPEARYVELIREGLGVPDIEVEVEDVMRWQARADVAERFRDGRILLVGDAAHVMPPYGGYGGNTGMHDAQNLAWKLDAVLRGAADPALLETYDAERRPIAVATAEQAYSRYVTRAAPDLAKNGFAEIIPDTDIDLGCIYASPSVIADADSPGPGIHPYAEMHGMPGGRAPHVALRRDGEALSTIDLFGRGFALLAGPRADAWCEAGAAAADLVPPGVAPAVHRIGGDGGLEDVDRRFCEVYGVGPEGAALVRPDGVVAWRAAGARGAGAPVLRDVLEAVLCRAERPAAVAEQAAAG